MVAQTKNIIAQNWAKVLVAVIVALGVGTFWYFDLGRYLNLEYLREVQASGAEYVASNRILSSAAYFAMYVLVTGLSLPGAAVMTLAGGAVFGFTWGLGLVSFASTLGATAAMVISRTLIGEWVQRRFAGQLRTVNAGFDADGGFFLFSVRMVPLFPFFIVNLVMGLTRISVWQFYWVSQIGMLTGTVVYVFAGTQLARVNSVGDILSPGLIAAMAMLGLFPLLARKLIKKFREFRDAAVR